MLFKWGRKMSSLILYKCQKKYVTQARSDNKYIQSFMHMVQDHDQYIDDEDSLRDICESDEEFEVLKKFFDKHDLWDFDLVVEEWRINKY